MPNILIFSDLHCSESSAQSIVERAHEADIVIGAGDFANQHRGIERTLNILKTISKPFVCVPGNNETLDELTHACLNWPTSFVLHGSGVSINGIDIFGIGGGIPVTPFGSWSYDFSENEAGELLEACEKVDILVTHSPPKGHVDRTSNGMSVGSEAVLDFVVRKEPKLVVCGHIHDSWKQESTLNQTRIINVGPQSQLLEI